MAHFFNGTKQNVVAGNFGEVIYQVGNVFFKEPFPILFPEKLPLDCGNLLLGICGFY